jgi:hypothetical protein
MRDMIRVGISLLLVVVFCRVSQAADWTRDEVRQRVRSATWTWKDSAAGLVPSLRRCAQAGFTWNVRSVGVDADQMEISLSLDNREIYRAKGNWSTTFFPDRENRHLYVMTYSPSASGGTIECIDVATGKRTWAAEIASNIEWPTQSILLYASARVFYELGGYIWVWGHESRGKFVQVIDKVDGAVVADKRFEN